MLLAFGLSWPFAIVRTLRAKRVDGKSPFFMSIVIFGYLLGIAAHLAEGTKLWLVAVYLVDVALVSTDFALYFRYRRKGDAESSSPDGKRFMSPVELMRDSWRLAAKVMESGWRPDVLVALWRGGATVGVAMHEFFKTAGWEVDHRPVKCWSYTGIGENAGEVRFEPAETLFAKIPDGAKVLVVDDVFDTGKTAAAVKRIMDSHGFEMRFASVYWKPGKNLTDLKPDYHVASLGDGWIVFPHEIEGLSAAEISRKDAVLADVISPFLGLSGL